MCTACEDIPVAQFSLDDPVVLRAQEIEQAMDGERVPESSWRVFLCISNEPISWKHYERVRAAMDEAKAHAARRRLKARQPRQTLACESVS